MYTEENKSPQILYPQALVISDAIVPEFIIHNYT